MKKLDKWKEAFLHCNPPTRPQHAHLIFGQKSPGASPVVIHSATFQKHPTSTVSSHLSQRTHTGAGPRAGSRIMGLENLCFCPLPHQLSEIKAPVTSVRQQCCLFWADGFASAAMPGSTQNLFSLPPVSALWCTRDTIKQPHILPF